MMGNDDHCTTPTGDITPVAPLDYPVEYAPPAWRGCAVIGGFVAVVAALALTIVGGMQTWRALALAPAAVQSTAALASAAVAPDAPPDRGADAASIMTAGDAPRLERFRGATLLYRAPVSQQACPALGAIEAGRPVMVVERRADWVRIRADGSGEVWTRAADLAIDGDRLARAIAAFAAPAPDFEACNLAGVAPANAVYRTLRETDQWLLVIVDDQTAWVRRSP